jgi:hypothetical protein
MWTNDVEQQVFFTAENFILHEVTITVWGNDEEMPVHFSLLSNYTTDDADAKSVVTKTPSNEQVWLNIMLLELAESTQLQPVLILNRETMSSGSCLWA